MLQEGEFETVGGTRTHKVDARVIAATNREAAEREHILKALELTRGRVSGPHGAAALLDINPKTLASRMRKLGLERRVDYG